MTSLDKCVTKFHGHQLMKLQLSYDIMFGSVQRLQIAHLIPFRAINNVSYNKFSKQWSGRAGPGRAGPVFRSNSLSLFLCEPLSVRYTVLCAWAASGYGSVLVVQGRINDSANCSMAWAPRHWGLPKLTEFFSHK